MTWHRQLKLKAQIFCGNEPAIGPGKADLLEAIDREGSISAAGRAMGLSYRRAWLLVDSMNRCWAEKLVEATAGGGAAKGARLTAFGRKVLDAYRALEQQLVAAAAQGSLDILTALLRDGPWPTSTPETAVPERSETLRVQSRLPQAFEGKAKRGSVTKR